MVVITLLRGFKVPVEILDAFLTANGIPEEHEMLGSGIPPFYDTDSDKVTTLLRQKSQNNKTRVFMPYRQPFDRALTAYIAYDWIWVFAQRRIKSEEVTSTCSAAFEELRKEILSYDTPGTVDDDEFQNDVFIIVTDEQSYAPPLWDRYYVRPLLSSCGKDDPD